MRIRAGAVLLCVAVTGRLWAQRAPDGELHLVVGSGRHLLARWSGGELTMVAACLPAVVPPGDGTIDVSSGHGVELARPRRLAIGSAEWHRASEPLLALAARREQAQRLAGAASVRGVRTLDWVFTAGTGPRAVYYFETARRVPSPAVDVDDVDADPPSTLRVFVSGFAMLDASGARPIGTKAELRWEEDGRPRGPQRPDLRPVAVVAAAEPVWLMESRLPSGAAVEAFAVGSRAVRRVGTTRLGGC